MRRSALRKKPVNQTAFTTTIPAPVKGLNSQDNLVAMDPTCAISMTNFIAEPFGCTVRTGSKKYVTGITGDVQTLLTYNGVTTITNKLFACAGSNIYDATSSGATPTVVQAGLANALWESASMTTPGGHYLVACNGVDATRHYDGTSWTTWTMVGSPTLPGQISGIDPATFSNVLVHKLRLWFVQNNSTRAYYLPINSVGGAATLFDFGPYMPRGGYLLSLFTWTLDAGTGMDDLLVAVTSEGDILIYGGTDPSSSSTWKLIGVWQLGRPTNKRCFMKLAGDVLYLCEDGLLPLSSYMQSDRLSNVAQITERIQNTISDLTTTYAGYSGWQLIQYPIENLIVFNVPQASINSNIQFIYNTITDAWSQFTGWPATCWATQNGRIFFGTTGQVTQAFTGYTDNAAFDGSGGTLYQASCQQAFNYFEKVGQQKQFKSVRPTITSTAYPSVSVGINIDFVFGITPVTISAATSGTSSWNVGQWGTAQWGSPTVSIKKFHTVSGVGYAASLTIVIDVRGDTTWSTTDWVFELGSAL